MAPEPTRDPFGDALRDAQAAQRQIAKARDGAARDRGRAVARAWRSRPGGMTWAAFADAFNAALPRAARLRTSALRLDEARHRAEVGGNRVEDEGGVP